MIEKTRFGHCFLSDGNRNGGPPPTAGSTIIRENSERRLDWRGSERLIASIRVGHRILLARGVTVQFPEIRYETEGIQTRNNEVYKLCLRQMSLCRSKCSTIIRPLRKGGREGPVQSLGSHHGKGSTGLTKGRLSVIIKSERKDSGNRKLRRGRA